MKALLLVTFASFASAAFAAAHLGFEVAESDKGLVVETVHSCSPNFFDGVSPGDKVVEVGGKLVKTLQQLNEVVGNRTAGKRIAVKVVRNGEQKKIVIELMESADVKEYVRIKTAEEAEGKRKAIEKAKKDFDREVKRLESEREYVEQCGPLLYVGRVRDNSIGAPEIVLLVTSLARSEIEAVRFKVAVYDKFGDPVPGVFGSSHEKEFLYQETIKPNGEVMLRLGIPWHSTAGKATVVATEYVMEGDEKVSPPRPKTIEVRR